MREVVAIPTAHRPELLAITLEKLSAARNRPEVHIYADSVPESRLREIEIVRDLYLPEAFLFRAKAHAPAVSGTWNILNSIKDAARWVDTVYLVEEDVLVYPYFFEWHRAQTTDISCGRIMHTHPDFKLYTNPGSRWGKKALDALVPHICSEYFQDRDAYCAKFPPVHISTLDDGLMRRVIAANELTWNFPEKPVCAHAGFRLLNQVDIYMIGDGTLEERIVRVRELIANPPNRERYARDWEPYLPE